MEDFDSLVTEGSCELFTCSPAGRDSLFEEGFFEVGVEEVLLDFVVCEVLLELVCFVPSVCLVLPGELVCVPDNCLEFVGFVLCSREDFDDSESEDFSNNLFAVPLDEEIKLEELFVAASSRGDRVDWEVPEVVFC